MKNLIKLLLTITLVFTLFTAFSLSASATEDTPETEPIKTTLPEDDGSSEEDPEDVEVEEPIEEEVVEVTTVQLTLDVEELYLIVLDEEGALVSVEATSEEGTLALEALELETMNLDTLLAALLLTAPEEYDIGFTFESTDEALLEAVSAPLVELYGEAVVTILSEVDDEAEEDIEPLTQNEKVANRILLASELGITPGKLNLIQKLEFVSGEDFILEDWVDSSVKDIMKAIKELRSVETETEPELEDSEDDVLETVVKEIKARPFNNKSKGKGKKK